MVRGVRKPLESRSWKAGARIERHADVRQHGGDLQRDGGGNLMSAGGRRGGEGRSADPVVEALGVGLGGRSTVARSRVNGKASCSLLGGVLQTDARI